MKKLILASMLIIISFNAVANIEVSKSAVAENAAKLIKAQPESLTKIIKKAISASPENGSDSFNSSATFAVAPSQPSFGGTGPVVALLPQTRSLI